MRHSIVGIAALFLFVVAAANGQSSGQPSSLTGYYGQWDSTAGTHYSVTSVMTDTALRNREVTVRGTVLDVCRKKGCWLVVTDGTSQMRVTFKDYGFFVPTDCDGRIVSIQGVVSVEEIPEDLAKHYAEESKSEDPEKITGAQTVITMVATGVQMVK